METIGRFRPRDLVLPGPVLTSWSGRSAAHSFFLRQLCHSTNDDDADGDGDGDAGDDEEDDDDDDYCDDGGGGGSDRSGGSGGSGVLVVVVTATVATHRKCRNSGSNQPGIQCSKQCFSSTISSE